MNLKSFLSKMYESGYVPGKPYHLFIGDKLFPPNEASEAQLEVQCPCKAQAEGSSPSSGSQK